MVVFKEVNLDDKFKSVRRSITGDKKISEQVVGYLFKEYKNISADIQLTEDESNAEPDLIFQFNDTSMTIETTEFKLQEKTRADSIGKLFTERLEKELTNRNLSVEKSCYITISVRKPNKIMKVNMTELADTIMKFFDEYKYEFVLSSIYQDEVVLIQYHNPTGIFNFQFNDLNPSFHLQYYPQSYCVDMYAKQTQRIVDDNKKKENTVDTLLVYSVDYFLDDRTLIEMSLILEKLKFKNIHIMGISEETYIFSKDGVSGGSRSVMSGDSFKVYVYDVRSTFDMSNELNVLPTS